MQVGNGHPAAAGERMGRCGDDHPLPAEERDRIHRLTGSGDRPDAEHQVGLVVCQCRGRPPRRTAPELHPGPGQPPGEGGDQGPGDVLGAGRGGHHPHTSGRRRRGHLPARAVGQADQFARPGGERAAARGQPDAGARAPEERVTEVGAQGGHRCRHRGLAHAEGGRRGP